MVNNFKHMSNDITNKVLVGVRLAPDTINRIDEIRTKTGGSRQDFIKMALFAALKA